MNEKLLKTVKEEVYRCSKCGLCQAVCPLYIAEKNEMFLPRGRYIVMNNFFNNNKPLSGRFIKNIDVCLNCNLCKDFCPSDIDTKKINVLIKNAARKKYSFIQFSFIYRVILNLYRLIPFKNTEVKRNKKSHQSFLRISGSKQSPAEEKAEQKKGSVIYFEGCYNKYVNPSDKNASLNLIEKLNYRVEKIISLCCGYPYVQEGNIKKFNKNAIKINNCISDDVSYIICSCDSCFDTLKHVIDDKFQSKLIRLDEFLKQNSYNFKDDCGSFYFKPLIRKEQAYLPPAARIMQKKGICSLMENFFIFKHKKHSCKIAKETFLTKEELENRVIFTSCLLSKWGLEKELKILKRDNKVYSYAEYAELKED